MFIEPFRADVYAKLASIYESLERWGDAVGHRRIVMEMEPADPIESRYQLALAHYRVGVPATASVRLQREPCNT